MKSGKSTVRLFGRPPFKIAVLHGGPGAPGYMAPVARELSRIRGILEPLQTGESVEKQIQELHQQLMQTGEAPFTLIGSSWGAVLALFTAARYPDIIAKIILIGSAVFDSASSAQIHQTRMSRLTPEQKQQYDEIEKQIESADSQSKADLFKKWGELFSRLDSFDPIDHKDETIEVQPQIFNRVWNDFVNLRDKPHCLKEDFSKIKCPLVIIHGDYDPHPLAGIQPFLENCVENVRTYILEKCGHYPWLEKYARDKFYNLVVNEIVDDC